MFLKKLGPWAMALMALVCLPAMALAQASSTLSVKDSAGTLRNLAAQTDAAGSFHYRDVMEGLLNGAPTALAMDPGGTFLGVVIESSVLPTGAATSALQTSVGTTAHTDAQAIVAAAATLPTGAATSALQTSVGATAHADAIANDSAPGTSATTAAGVQGVTGGVGIDTVVKGTAVDRGGTITTASTAQTFAVANTARRGLHIQNQSTSALYFSCSATATLDYHSLQIPAGSYYETSNVFVGTGACSIIGATQGAAFYAREF